MKRTCSALLCILIIISLTGCFLQQEETKAPSSAQETQPAPVSTEETAPPESQPEGETEAVLETKTAPKIYTKKFYSLAMPTAEDPGQVCYLDEQGAILENVTIPTPLHDVVSGKLRYYTVTEYDKNGTLTASWLYSAKGKVLEGSGNCTYEDCLGNLIIMQPKGTRVEEAPDASAGGQSWLYDPSQKAVVAENVFSLEKITGKTAICLDAKRRILGVYDMKGQMLHKTPYDGDFTCGYCCGSYILGYPPEGCAILNEELVVVDTAPKMFDMELYDCGAQGVLCLKKDNDLRHIYRVDDWKMLGTFPTTFQTTDGINTICGDEFSKDVKLHSMRGKRLAGPYDKISFLRDENEALNGLTLARKDDVVYVLNKHGSVLAQRRIPGLTRAYNIYDGLILCEYEFENDWTGQTETGFSLLDQGLRWVSDRDRNFIRLERVTKNIFAGTRQNGEQSFRTDLYNEKAEVIFKRVERFGTADDAAIAVCDKEHFGLIDHEGNWIAKMDLPEGVQFSD